MNTRKKPVAALCVLMASAATQPQVLAADQSVYREEFDGLEPTLQINSADCDRLRIEQHRRDQSAKSGTRSEYFRLRAGSGTHVHAAHSLDAIRVIHELRLGIWVRADRLGPQLMARVVLPRTAKRGGEPIRMIIRGDTYSQIGSWQRLVLKHPDELVQQRVTGLRAEHGSWIDPREAYIDQVVVNVFGGPGETNIWLDALEVAGGVPAHSKPSSKPWPETRLSPVARVTSPVDDNSTLALRPVAVRGTRLVFHERPIFIRAIEHRGEDPRRLAELGFNTLALPRPLSAEQSRIADELSMWLIPIADDPRRAAEMVNSSSASVLAWYCDSGRAVDEPLRRRQQRPLVIGPPSPVLDFQPDIVVIDRPVLGTQTEMLHYVNWCRSLSTPAADSPLLLAIPSETEPATPSGSRADAPRPERFLQPHQVLLMTRLAAASGARGIIVRSTSPLDEASLTARIRAQTLLMANDWLRQFETWLAGGSVVGFADTSPSYVLAPVIDLNQSSLIVPIRLPSGTQLIIQRETSSSLDITVPGVPESNQVFLWTSSFLRTIGRRRAAGGLRVELPSHVASHSLLVTGDPKLTRALSKHLASQGGRAAANHRSLAALYLEAAIGIERELSSVAPRLPRGNWMLSQARRALSRCDELLTKENAVGAEHFARQCVDIVNQLCWLRWRQAEVSTPGSSSVFGNGFSQLPDHWSFLRDLQRSEKLATTILATEFEDLAELTKQGWKHFRSKDENQEADVSLSPKNPRSGSYCLRISADRKPRGAELGTPLAWVNSPPLNVSAGYIVRIRLWVRAAAANHASFMMFDSIGGPQRAKHINNTPEWQEVVWYRAVDQPRQIVLTLAMMSPGEAAVDSLSVDVFPLARPEVSP